MECVWGGEGREIHTRYVCTQEFDYDSTGEGRKETGLGFVLCLLRCTVNKFVNKSLSCFLLLLLSFFA